MKADVSLDEVSESENQESDDEIQMIQKLQTHKKII